MKLATKYIPEGWELQESDFAGEIRLAKIREDDDEPFLAVEFIKSERKAIISKKVDRQGVSLEVPWDGEKESIGKILKKAELKDRQPFKRW